MASIRRIILSLVACLMLIGVRNVAGAEVSSAPYIYYYANTINALVVERADGTDSRVIAPGAMPDDNIGIANLDWSLSGKWMAWESSTYNGPGAPTYGAWIARSDGSERLTLLDNIGLILALKWSPTDDLLYVAYGSPNIRLEMSIIDPEANTVIAHTDYQYDYPLWIEGFPSNSGLPVA